jgi:hypothetical protein
VHQQQTSSRNTARVLNRRPLFLIKLVTIFMTSL